MKLYHLLIAVTIAIGLVVGFTAYGGSSGGLLYDAHKYNDEINVSKFNTFDHTSDINDITDTMRADTEADPNADEDTEQDILSSLWSGTKNMANGVPTIYKMLTTIEGELSLPHIFFWTITAILAIYVFTKLLGRFFLDR